MFHLFIFLLCIELHHQCETIYAKKKFSFFYFYACVFTLCRCPEKRAQQANASLRAAFVHVLGDLLQSVSVMISAIIIYFKVSHRHLIPDVYGSGPAVQGRPLLDVLRSVPRYSTMKVN